MDSCSTRGSSAQAQCMAMKRQSARMLTEAMMGARPNLHQMHSHAVQNRILEDLTEQQMVQFIENTKSRTAGVPTGVRVYNV